MLQIITGKFFATEDCHVTRHRAALYTNYRTHWDIETVAGALRPAEGSDGVATLIYEVDQRLERSPTAGFQLGAASPSPLIADFAAVTSFVLNVTCTPDADLARRLTQTSWTAPGIPHPPRDYIGRVFDVRVAAAAGDAERLRVAFEGLVALERRSYEGAIRAIRRYVMGLHRLSDDLDLAYVLLVASMEALAQKFDEFTPAWLDVPHDKRTRIDAALAGVDAGAGEKVRSALLDEEHIAVSRRFREFALAQVGPDFFRDQARELNCPVGRIDLAAALGQAYQYRSRYVHTLTELPRLLSSVAWEGETIGIEGRPALTFRGLARVARAVISAFIAAAPRSEREEFDWRSALPGTIRVPVAPRYWISRADAYGPETARRYLNGFLGELAGVLSGDDDHITDLREVFSVIERVSPKLSPESRRPMLTLTLLYHKLVQGAAAQRPEWAAFAERYSGELDSPSVESLVAHALLNEAPPWDVDVLAEQLEAYRAQRLHKQALALPPILEAAVTLYVAQAAQQAGDAARARALVKSAVDNFPGHEALLELERRIGSARAGGEPLGGETPEELRSVDTVVGAAASARACADGIEADHIGWRAVLLPPKKNELRGNPSDADAEYLSPAAPRAPSN